MKEPVRCRSASRLVWVTGLLLLTGCATTPDHLLHLSPTTQPLWIFQVTLPGVLRSPRDRFVVPMDVTFINTSHRVIQNVRFTFAAYDSLGMPVRGHLNGRRIGLTVVAPGPFIPGQAYEISTQPRGIPSMAASCVELRSLTITPRGAPPMRVRGSKVLATYLAPMLRGTCRDRGPAVFLFPQNGD